MTTGLAGVPTPPTHSRPLESDQTRRAPWSGVRGRLHHPRLAGRGEVDVAEVAAGEGRVPEFFAPMGGRGDAVGSFAPGARKTLIAPVRGFEPP